MSFIFCLLFFGLYRRSNRIRRRNLLGGGGGRMSRPKKLNLSLFRENSRVDQKLTFWHVAPMVERLVEMQPFDYSHA
jgi:hypothetical protein